jgi:hypothetical protein
MRLSTFAEKECGFSEMGKCLENRITLVGRGRDESGVFVDSERGGDNGWRLGR